MIVFIYGTTAEAIKIAPIVRRLDQRGIPYQQWLTFQHTAALVEILPSLGLRSPERVITNGRNGQPLRSKTDVLFWLWQIGLWTWKNARPLRRTLPANTVIVVHGDTVTTVVGAWLARRLRKPSAHVEAGLRSGNWRHPFPEELDRRIAGKLVTIHYAPSEEAAKNLGSARNVLHTRGNTIVDALLDDGDSDPGVEGNFGVVLLHRFEFLGNRALVEETIAVLNESPYPMRFFIDEYAKELLSGLLETLDRSRFQVQQKLGHSDFIRVLKSAQFVVTDSGGIQAEAALLGIPTLVHRKATEQNEGVGENIVVSGWKIEVLSSFLKEFRKHRRPAVRPAFSPSDLIVEDLVRRGFA